MFDVTSNLDMQTWFTITNHFCIT